MATKITSGSIFSAGAVVTGVDADAPPAVPSPAPEPSPAPATSQILPLSRAVSLLMDASATADGSVVDSSSNSHPITVNGDVSQSSFSPYRSGGYSWEFDGNGDYISIADHDDFNFSSGDFTVEMWINAATQSTNWPGIFSGSDYNAAGSASLRFDNVGHDNKLFLYTNGLGDPALTTTNTLSHNTWHHIALVRSGTSLSFYVNGTQDGTTTISSGQTFDFSVGEFRIGRGFDVDGGNAYFAGKIADVRAIKGSATYTADFTPPTERLTEVAGTSLLTCNLPYLQSGLTAHGDVSPVAAGPYNYARYSESLHGGSYVFDGSSRLTLSSQMHVSGEFAIESWVYLDDNYSDPYVCGTLDGSNIQILRIHGGYPYFTHRAYQSFSDVTAGTIEDGGLRGDTLLKSGQWYHLALTRDTNNTLRIFVNGQVDAAATWSHGFNFNTIGALTSGNGYMQGNMSDFRVVLNSPVYTEAFTPSTAPLEAVSGTSILLSGNNAAIRDESQSVESISVFGNTTVADSSPYGTGKSMTFDGSGDYLYSHDSSNAVGTQDFTLECWIYAEGNPSDQGIFESRSPGGPTDGFTLTAFSSSVIRIWCGGALVSSSGTNYVNEWTHLAVTRSSGTMTLYINGISQGSASTSFNLTNDEIIIGAGRYFDSNADPSSFFNGNIADLRIVKGTAVYTENFTVPSAPLGDYSETVSSPEPAPEPSGPVELVGEPSVSSFSHIPSTRYATPGSPAVTEASTGVDVGRPDTGSSASAMIDVTVEVGTEYEFSFTADTQSGDTMFMGVIPAQGATTPEFGYVGDNALGQYPNTVHNRASVSGSGDSQTIVFTATQTDLQIVMWNSYSENLVNVQFISLKATS